MTTGTLYIMFFVIWFGGFATGIYLTRHITRTQRTTIRFMLFVILASLTTSLVGAFAGVIVATMGMDLFYGLPALAHEHPYLVQGISFTGMAVVEFLTSMTVTAYLLPKGRAREQ